MKRLNTVDASFLLAEHRKMPMHTGGLLLFTYPEGANEDWLHKAISESACSEAVQAPFNQKLVRPATRFGYPHWVVDGELDIDYHVRQSALPKPGRYREMFALVSRLHSTRLHRDRPLWEVHIIEGVERNRFAMYFKAHHSLVDGVGAMRLLCGALSPDPGERSMPMIWEKPARVSMHPPPRHAATQVLGEAIGTVTGALRGVARYAMGAVQGEPHGLVGPFQSPETMLNGRVTGSRRFVAQSYALPRIRAVASALGATVNDIVLAMSAGALRRYLIDHGALPERPLTAMAPVSVRPADAEDAGNAFSMILTTLATEVSDPVQRLRAIQRSVGEGKELLRSLKAPEIAIYTSVVSLPILLPLALNVAGRTRPAFNVTVSNVPGPKERLYWNGARLEGMYPLSIVSDGQALNITVTSCVDSLDFGIIACRRSVPGAQRLIDHLEAALAELEKASTVGS